MQMFKTATKRTLFGGGLGLAAIAGSLAVAMAFAQPAQAATDTGTFQVQLTVEAACFVRSTNSLDFGTSDGLFAFAAPALATGTFDVLCTSGTPYDVGLDLGANWTGASRAMKSPGGTVRYVLYSDESRQKNWGETVGDDTVADTGTGVAQTLTIYGRVPSQISVPTGIYTDTITITITF